MNRFYLKAARADDDVDKIAKYLAVLALLGHEQLCYWPSTVAASLVILACLAENKQSTYQQITWVYNLIHAYIYNYTLITLHPTNCNLAIY